MTTKRASVAWATLLCALLTACGTPQVLPPGPGATAPRFLDAGHWIASDGYVLALSNWPAQDAHTVIVALHGMNDYGRFIEGAAKHWQGRGITTYAYDQRGFGRTEGNGRWPGHETMAEDVHAFMALVRTHHPTARVFLLGESMGGAVAMVAAAGRAEPVADGLILVSPALWGWSNLDFIKRSGLWAMMQIAPGGHLSGRGLGIKPSDNDDMLAALGRDPYVIKRTRVDALYGLVDLMEAAWQVAPAVRLPTFVLYAPNDDVVPSRPIADAAARMPGTVHVVCFGDGFHMLLRDLKAERTWDAIADFVEGPNAQRAREDGCKVAG
jgi:alpha-beta hydrolase superfamily lysophospholipase